MIEDYCVKNIYFIIDNLIIEKGEKKMKKILLFGMISLMVITIFSSLSLSVGVFAEVEDLPATIDIIPDTLNLNDTIMHNRGLITSYIELPEGYNVSGIIVSSILLNDTVSAELEPIAIGDYDNDAVPDLMVIFNRTLVVEYILSRVSLPISNATYNLTLTGKFHGIFFEGSDTVKVSDLLCDLNCNGKVDLFDAVVVGATYGSTPEDPNWNLEADLAPQYGIINVYDAVTMASHYGEPYP